MLQGVFLSEFFVLNDNGKIRKYHTTPGWSRPLLKRRRRGNVCIYNLFWISN